MYNDDKLKVYFDAEFTGLHKDTTLISIGLVSENGRYFYAEFNDYDKYQCDDWIKENVLNNLIYDDNFPETNNMNNRRMLVYGSKEYIGHALKEWLKLLSEDNNKQIQMYCDCYAYDWMLFNDLICENGKALNLPDYIYYIPMDLSTALQLNGYDPDITREEFIRSQLKLLEFLFPLINDHGPAKHNSLWDAYICKECFTKLSFLNDEKNLERL